MMATTNWNSNLNWTNTTNTNQTSNKDTKVDNSSSSNSSGVVSNPNATLDKDAFLKLLLIELQHQDPTDPMDSDKMLTQTSQLSALEMQQNTNTTMQKMVETMEKLSNSFSTSMSTAAVGAIGKMATVNENKVKLTGADEVIALKMYLPEDSDDKGITLEVYDKNNKLVFSEKSNEGKEVSKGLFTLEWPGRNNDGVYAGDGEYSVKVVYNNKNGEKITANYGTYPIEGIKFVDGIAYAKMGGQYVSFDDIGEISDYKLGSSSTSVGDSSSGDSSDGDSSNSGSTEDGDKEEKA
ncbi:flagellar basal body rod modification protein [Campylobacter jejuni]|uniref:Basal-body rod modification protein FlgD n=2 Tax=Campylobacteraceae TaxID=72294 RepID=A0A431B4C5_CAMJU|nr:MULTISPECIES: flagellar basal body rod modification protein [Campylobacter]ECL1093724.1 flagellar basal body rod modification protein [Campylobacter jejuni]ECL9136683.1 flagellar basal body rod modification protein [Campylobacter jejuni]EEA6199847.1 flagellar basal body rod modification protein [Campylobacter jejuni]EJQ2688403.1 flagellar basal body rod modification protein [Campylobacter jejuni]ELT9982692.1 flagellar basal body rod modification protein [Campylobacter jejuni]